MRELWPPSEPAQVDYERLRAGALAQAPLLDAAAARFARGGLAALIVHPVVTEPVFVAMLHGAARPPWTPHHDPRLDALAAGIALVLSGCEPDELDSHTGLAR